jgi:hypothetical protein
VVNTTRLHTVEVEIFESRFEHEIMNISFSAAGAKLPRKITSCLTNSSTGKTTSDTGKARIYVVTTKLLHQHIVSIIWHVGRAAEYRR